MEFSSNSPEWTPSDEDWETIKQRSLESEARVTIRAVNRLDPSDAISQVSVSISTSQDAVEAPIFYREVNLPFLTAVKNPAAYIRWRFGAIDSKKPPPIVLDKLPVCGNCHSFSADGSTLAMEIDSGNDKGSYAIASIEKHIALDDSKVITWSDYRKEDGDRTFGLLCQVSPDGRYVLGTVKDRALAVYRPDLTFSQLFFSVKGILAIYDREAKTFSALPGADDQQFVQTNATWSPDGRTIVFARSKAYEPDGVDDVKSVLVPREAAEDFLTGRRKFRYDLYRIPFNDGKGGKAEPVEGASHNGMSNYFAKFSPDGRWIVFCQAESFMLLQPDSQLYIIPSQGGQARRLRCNTWRMNSWHSWSPNGKWLVFSSKAYSPYTQLFLTHIDEQGFSSVPVVLSRFTEPERAANIPEFVNVGSDAIQRISAAFLDDYNYYRAAIEFVRQDDPMGAVPLFEKSLEVNPENVDSRLKLATILAADGRSGEAKAHFVKILGLQPDHADAHQHLAVILYGEQKLEEAADHYRQALRSNPTLYHPHEGLGRILLETGNLDEASGYLAEAVRLQPESAFTNYYYGHVLHRKGKPDEAASYYRRAVGLDSEFVPALLGLVSIHLTADRSELHDLDKALALAKKACDVTGHEDPAPLEILAGVYVAAGQLEEAENAAKSALRVARAAGNQDLVDRIQKRLELCRRLQVEK